MQTQYTILYKYLNEGNAITNDAEYNPTNIFYTGESKINFNLLRFGDLSSAGYNLTLSNYTNTLKSQYVEKYKKEGEEEKLITMKNAYLEKEKFKNLYLYDRTDTVYSKVFIPEQSVLLANRNRIPEQQRPTSENDFTKPFKFLDNETCYLDPKFIELYAKEYITEEINIEFDDGSTTGKTKGEAVSGTYTKYSTIIKTNKRKSLDTYTLSDITDIKLSDYNITAANFDKMFPDASTTGGPYTHKYIKPLIGETTFLKLSTSDVDNNYSSLNKTRSYNYKGNFIYDFEEEVTKELPLKTQIDGIGNNGEEPVLFKSVDYITDNDVTDNFEEYFSDSSTKAPGWYTFNGEDYLVTKMALQILVARKAKNTTKTDFNSLLKDSTILKYLDSNGNSKNTSGTFPKDANNTKCAITDTGILEYYSPFFSYLFISKNGTSNLSKTPNFTDISKIGDLNVGFISSSFPNGVNTIYKLKEDMRSTYDIPKYTGTYTTPAEYTKWSNQFSDIVEGSTKRGYVEAVDINGTSFKGQNVYIDRDNCNYTHIRSFSEKDQVSYTTTKNPKQVVSMDVTEFTGGNYYYKDKTSKTVIKIDDSNYTNVAPGMAIMSSTTTPTFTDPGFKKLKTFSYGTTGWYIHYFGIPKSVLESAGYDSICTEVDIIGKNISQKVLLPNEYNSDSAPYFIKDIYKKIDEAPWMVYSHEKSLQAAVNKCKSLVKRVGIDNVKLIKNINVESIIDVN